MKNLKKLKYFLYFILLDLLWCEWIWYLNLSIISKGISPDNWLYCSCL